MLKSNRSKLTRKLEDLKDSKSSCDEDLADISKLKHKINCIFGIAFGVSLIALGPAFLYFGLYKLPATAFFYNLSINLAFIGAVGITLSSALLIGNNLFLGIVKTLFKMNSKSLEVKCNNIKRKINNKTITKGRQRIYNRSVNNMINRARNKKNSSRNNNSSSENSSNIQYYEDFYIKNGETYLYDDKSKKFADRDSYKSSVKQNSSNNNFSKNNSNNIQCYEDFYIKDGNVYCYDETNVKKRVRRK